MSLNIGDVAPSFELPDTELKMRTLDETPLDDNRMGQPASIEKHSNDQSDHSLGQQKIVWQCRVAIMTVWLRVGNSIPIN